MNQLPEHPKKFFESITRTSMSLETPILLAKMISCIFRG
jgi:hypothetical protein